MFSFPGTTSIGRRSISSGFCEKPFLYQIACLRAFILFRDPSEFGGAGERLLSCLAKSEKSVVSFGPGNGQTNFHFGTLDFSSASVLLRVPEMSPG